MNSTRRCSGRKRPAATVPSSPRRSAGPAPCWWTQRASRSWPAVIRSATWPPGTSCRRPCTSGWGRSGWGRSGWRAADDAATGRATISGWTPPGWAGSRWSGISPPWPACAGRGGSTRRPSHPGRAGRPLRLRRHPGRDGRPDLGSRALRRRGSRVNRGARSQPPRVQLPDRGPDHRAARRGAARPGPARPARPAAAAARGPGRGPGRPPGPGRGHVPARRGGPRSRGPGTAAADARAGRPAAARWTRTAPRRPACTRLRSWSCGRPGPPREPRLSSVAGRAAGRAGRPRRHTVLRAEGGRGRPGPSARKPGWRYDRERDRHRAADRRGAGSGGHLAHRPRRARRGPALRPRHHLGRDRRAGRPGGGRGGGPGTGRAGRSPSRPGRPRGGGIPPETAEPRHADGDRIGRGTEVLRIRGPLRELLGAERTLLNVLTHLSGIATATRAWADALAGTGCAVRDTRKTTPGSASSRSTPCAAAAAPTTGWAWATPR